jgi:hypothetical protein
MTMWSTPSFAAARNAARASRHDFGLGVDLIVRRIST